MALPPGDTLPNGPLGGRNLYAPHQPWFSFPAQRASALPQGNITVRTGLYYVNEFSTKPFNPSDFESSLDENGRLSPSDQVALTALDYESTVWELGMDYQALPRLRFSVDWRLHARYGGGLDSFIEWWHKALGVANAGREYFYHNMSRWDVELAGHPNLTGVGNVVASGDLDLRALWTAYTSPSLILAAGGAFKIPLGKRGSSFSSGRPDLGINGILEWRISPRWILYSDAGLIIPLGGGGRLMGQFIPSLEFRASRSISLLLQANIQSSPVVGVEEYLHPIFKRQTLYAMPQTDIKIGLKGQHGDFGWEFYFEEDPLTWEGPDILFFFGGSYQFSTIPKKF